ncbi:hypothetical protein ACQ4LE_009526 [Meloidogyne hapla]
MFLVPPDCSHSEAVLRINNSLKHLQRYTNHIFSNANQRLRKCQERIDLQLGRIEVIEKKVELLDQVDEFPVFHCASRYPELCIAGFREPIFGSAMTTYISGTRNQTNKPMDELEMNCTSKIDSLKTIMEGIERKKNGGSFAQKSKKVDSPGPVDSLQSVAKIQKLNVTQLFISDISQYESAQVGKMSFSNSLLDGLEMFSSSIGGKTISMGNKICVETLDYSQSDVYDLGEQIEFNLPEDLPGFDTKSLEMRSISTLFRSEEHLSSKKETHASTSILCIPNESELKERHKHGSFYFEDHSEKDVVSSPITSAFSGSPPNHLDASSILNTQVPPPPPPHLQQSKTISNRSDLMAAIRATGGVQGAGLKRVKNVNDRESSNNEQNVEEEDLMTSLTRVLAMRRRGISGRQKSSISKSMGSVLREQIPTRLRTGSSSGEDRNDGEVGSNEWVDE